jgi:hypothetical protein
MELNKKGSQMEKRSQAFGKKITDRSVISSEAVQSAYEYQKKVRRKKATQSFASQEVDIKKYIISPEGYEVLMFFVYFLTIPYFAGALFLFLVVAKGTFSHFLVFKLSSYFIIWAIGYEVVAAVILFFILLNAIKFFRAKPI